jgi:hypothetical protein
VPGMAARVVVSQTEGGNEVLMEGAQSQDLELPSESVSATCLPKKN